MIYENRCIGRYIFGSSRAGWTGKMIRLEAVKGRKLLIHK